MTTIDPNKPKIMFDAGPIINMSLNNLLWVLPRMKHFADVQYFMTNGVRAELIDRPLQTKKYKLEALQILPYLVDGTIQLIDDEQIDAKSEEIGEIFNSMVLAKGHPVQLLHKGELTSVAACLVHDIETFVVDERTTRYLIETPHRLRKRMEKKLKTSVTIDKLKLQQAKKMFRKIRCIRSVEIISAAYKHGFFCHFEHQSPKVPVPHIDEQLLEGLLWALKLNGCAITVDELKEMRQIVSKMKVSCHISQN